jgi:hypothetical protein
MPIDFAPPSPDLSPPQITPATYTSPLQSAQKLQELRNAQAQNAQYQAQTAQTQAVTKGVGLSNTQTALDIQSGQGFLQAYQDNHGDVDKTLQAAPGYNVLPKDIMAFGTHMANLAKTRAETDTATLAATDKMHDLLNQSYQPLFNEPDAGKRAAMLPGINQSILQQSPGIRPNELLQSADDQTIQHAQAAYTTQQWIKTQADALKDKAAAAQANQETADKQRASAVQDYQAAAGPDGTVSDPEALARLQQQYPKTAFPTTPAGAKAFIGSQVPVEKQPEYGMKNLEFTNAGSLNPQSIQQRADLMFNPNNYSGPIKAQVQREHDTAVQSAIAAMPLGTAAVNKAFTDSSDRIGRLTAGVAQANATIPAKVTVVQAAAAAQGNARETEAGRQAYVKSGEDLNTANESADQLQAMVDAARGGNKIAYSYAPTTGVMTMNTAQGIKRVNMGQVTSLSGAGSAGDRILGWLGKQTSGESIDPSVLNDLAAMPGIVRQNAAVKHNANIDSIKTGYGIDFTPNKVPVGQGRGAQGAPNAPQRVTTQSQFDALPSGAIYIGSDGVTQYRKP